MSGETVITIGFPRTRGDEPAITDAVEAFKKFSPHTRG